MDRHAGVLRQDAPTLFTSVLHGDGMEAVLGWVREAVEYRLWAPATSHARGEGNHDHPH